MWKTQICLEPVDFFIHKAIVEKERFSTKGFFLLFYKSFPQKSFPLSTGIVEKSKTGIDICRNVPNVVLQILIPAFQRGFYLLDRVQDRRMIFTKFLTDVRCTEIC